MATQNPENFSASTSCSVSVEETTDLKTSQTLVATQECQKPDSTKIDTKLIDNSDVVGVSRMGLIPDKELVAPSISADSANIELNLNPQNHSYNKSDKTAEIVVPAVSDAETEFAASSGSSNLVNAEETTLTRRISDTKEPNLQQDNFNFGEPNETTPLLGYRVSVTNRMNFESERTSKVSESNLREQTRLSQRRNKNAIVRFLRWFNQTTCGQYMNEIWLLLIFFMFLVIMYLVLLLLEFKYAHEHKHDSDS